MGTHRFQVKGGNPRLSWLRQVSLQATTPSRLLFLLPHENKIHNLLFVLVAHNLFLTKWVLNKPCCQTLVTRVCLYFQRGFPNHIPKDQIRFGLQTLVTFGVFQSISYFPSYRLHLELDLFVGSCLIRARRYPIHLAPQHLKHYI